MDENLLSTYGYSFTRSANYSGSADRFRQGPELCQGYSRAQSSTFGHAQLFDQDRSSKLAGYTFKTQPQETTQSQTSLNVEAPEFTPRLSQQLPISPACFKRTNNLGNGVFFKPAQLVRNSTDPDKDWI